MASFMPSCQSTQSMTFNNKIWQHRTPVHTVNANYKYKYKYNAPAPNQILLSKKMTSYMPSCQSTQSMTSTIKSGSTKHQSTQSMPITNTNTMHLHPTPNSESESESENIIDFVVNKGNGIKGLVDSGIQTVPHLYILPVEERLHRSKVLPQEAIPVIDVSNWDDPTVMQSICEAAGKWGFFQIINHGLPLQLLHSVKQAAHRFFGLPNEDRNNYWAGNSPTDTVTLKTSFVPHAETVLEWKDYLSFRYVPEDHQSVALWPPVCKDEVLEYTERAEPVIRKLLEVLLKGLKVKEVDKAREYTLMASPIVNLVYYPRCPNPDLTAGVRPHSDISTITLLLQDDNGGLYVRAPDDGDGWIHVPPIEGALVINIGDILQIMSNDRYKSIEHRVVTNGSKNRVSVPIFVNPGPDAVFGPLPEALESGEQPLYKEVVFSDYFKFFFSKKHEGKKTMDFVRI